MQDYLDNHLRSFVLDDFGPLEHCVWEPDADQAGAGWHVIIGDNGSGKTSVLKALSLALLSAQAPASLRVPVDRFVRHGARSARVSLETAQGKRRWSTARMPKSAAPGYHAAFGSNRRFVGDTETARLGSSDPAAARHASLFDPDWSLGDLVGWLKDLQIDHPGPGGPLDGIQRFVNQDGLLPGLELEGVDSKGPRFVDAAGAPQRMGSLSDGYQSVLGLTLELLRQLHRDFGHVPFRDEEGAVSVDVAGVVLVDEIDAHLHPSWQQRIGFFFTEHFPRMQFLVTSHSPLVCRAAEHGSIFRLPALGSDHQPGMVSDEARDRLIYGDVLDAYGTEVFGERITRGRAGQAKFDRLAELNVKARFATLEEGEQGERQRLQQLLVSES